MTVQDMTKLADLECTIRYVAPPICLFSPQCRFDHRGVLRHDFMLQIRLTDTQAGFPALSQHQGNNCKLRFRIKGFDQGSSREWRSHGKARKVPSSQEGIPARKANKSSSPILRISLTGTQQSPASTPPSKSFIQLILCSAFGVAASSALYPTQTPHPRMRRDNHIAGSLE